MDVKARLVTIRKSLALRQVDFAAALGVSDKYVGHLETGVRDPSIKLAMKIEALAHERGSLEATGLVSEVVAQKVRGAASKAQAA